MAHYFDLDPDRFKRFFLDKQFVETVSVRELVFIRKHDRNQSLWIKVYSSLSSSGARECGGDAIRVIGIFDDGAFIANRQFISGKKNFALYNGARVYRTTSQESIEERTLERMRECYARLNEWNNGRI
jgi:hypothetical protein